MNPGDLVPSRVRRLLRPIWWNLRSPLWSVNRHARIPEPTGKLPIEKGERTFVVGVGPNYDQRVPTAMMTIRAGYSLAFEALEIPHVILDVRELTRRRLEEYPKPILFLFGADYVFMDRKTIRGIKEFDKVVWVDPWFKDSELFFRSHKLDPAGWTWPNSIRNKILRSEPTFVFTATVERGLCFFSEWEARGVRVVSLPLACDSSLYNPAAECGQSFIGTDLAFVGGYWCTKGAEIDKYLRHFEDRLRIYGRSPWPYKGYRGRIAREAEPVLYRQAKVSPTINEPSVRVLHGQINERAFKVMGSGGVTVVDAVPAYRDIFNEDELLIPKNVEEFRDYIYALLEDENLREKYRATGHQAIVQRHTYSHRVRKILELIEHGRRKKRSDG